MTAAPGIEAPAIAVEDVTVTYRNGFTALHDASFQVPAVQGVSNGMLYFPTIDETFSLYVKVILGMGLVFQMPMLVFFLARFGVISARFMISKFKYAVLIIFIIAAVITPSADIVTQPVLPGANAWQRGEVIQLKRVSGGGEHAHGQTHFGPAEQLSKP